MQTTRLRKQGKAVVVTIPDSIAENLDMTTEYTVKMDDHGAITLIPILNNPYKDAEDGEYYEKDVWDEMRPAGKEVW